jgi:phosphate transport system substrate-binding protein
LADEFRRGRACALLFALLLAFSFNAAAAEFRIGGTGAALATIRQLADDFMARNPDIRITTAPNLGSGGGIKAVVSGAIGLAVAARPLDESERKLGAVETEFARTPFVFAVSANSTLSAITTAEIADIYAGKMAVWADGSPVRVVLRLHSDSDTENVKSISAEVRRALMQAEARPGVQISVSDQDAADALERIPGAIGPTSLALILSEKRALRALRLDDKEPTLKNTAAGAYPYYKRFFLVTGPARAEVVDRFIAFVRSPAGRQIIARNGQWTP